MRTQQKIRKRNLIKKNKLIKKEKKGHWKNEIYNKNNFGLNKNVKFISLDK